MNSKKAESLKKLALMDLQVAGDKLSSNSVEIKMLCGFHLEKAVERTLALKYLLATDREISSNNIKELINKCDSVKGGIDIPNVIRNKADMLTYWGCCYYDDEIIDINKRILRGVYNFSGKTSKL